MFGAFRDDVFCARSESLREWLCTGQCSRELKPSLYIKSITLLFRVELEWETP